MTSTNKAKVDEELKKLALAYITATNAGDSSLAETILHNIEEIKRITTLTDAKNTEEFN